MTRLLILIITLLLPTLCYSGRPSRPIITRAPLLMLFTANQEKLTFIREYQYEKYHASQSMQLADNCTVSKEGSRFSPLGLSFGAYFKKNHHLGIQLSFVPISFPMYLNYQYDFIKWSTGKVATGVLYGGDLFMYDIATGVQILAVQKIKSFSKTSFSTFFSSQLRTWRKEYEHCAFERYCNTVSLNKSTFSPLLGVETTYKFDLSTWSAKLAFGHEKTLYRKIKYEEKHPTHYKEKSDDYFILFTIGILSSPND